MATPPSIGSGNTPLPDPLRVQIEGWFSRRGVPQLIAGYATERHMDTRARPFVAAWLVMGVVLWWGTRSDWSVLSNAAGVMATLVAIGVGLTALRKLRGGVPWWVDQRLDAGETFALGALVAGPSATIEGSLFVGLVDGRNALIGIGVIYGVIGLGVGAIAWWSVGRLRQELAHISGLLGRTLPTLLILVLFLMFAAELWEAAHVLSGLELLAVVLLLTTVAALLIVTAFRSEISGIETAGWDEMRPRSVGTPAEPLTHVTPDVAPPQLRGLQRLNLIVLVLLGQLIQSIFVALVVTAFLVLFGMLVLPGSLQESWIGSPIVALARYGFLGESRILSRELVTVAVLLGSVVGLYFTGLAITDSAYRPAHFERLLIEVRQLVAARAYYAVAVADPTTPADPTGNRGDISDGRPPPDDTGQTIGS